MVSNINQSNIDKFIKTSEPQSTTLILSLSIISCGLYLILWTFLLNRKLEEYDKHAPDSNRGLTLMLILPIIWIFIIYTLKSILFQNTPLIITFLEITIWIIILILNGIYLKDLSHSISTITQHHPILWIGLYSIGLIGILGIITMQLYIIPFFIGILFATLGTQSELNSLSKSHTIRKIDANYYKR